VKLEDFIGSVVFCRWIDITSFPKIDDLDAFVKEQPNLNVHSLVFMTFGKVVGVDKKVLLLAPTFSEKDKYIPKRIAHDPMSIPRGCILEMRELEFKKEGKVYLWKDNVEEKNDNSPGSGQDLEVSFQEDRSRPSGA